MKPIILIILAVLTAAAEIKAISAEEILSKVDRNVVTSSIRYKAKLDISISGKVMSKQFQGYSTGNDKAYMEFTSPSSDSGKRFLRVKDTFWMYLPSVGKATKLSGAATRSSLMGSDFSYDDAIENEKLSDLYFVTLEKEEKVNGSPCYVIKLTLKPDKNASYFIRKIWVDKSNFSYLKAEFYSKSMTLLKTVQVLEFKQIGAQYYPTHIKMENKLRKDTWTEFKLTDVQIGASIPAEVFTVKYLER